MLYLFLTCAVVACLWIAKKYAEANEVLESTRKNLAETADLFNKKTEEFKKLTSDYISLTEKNGKTEYNFSEYQKENEKYEPMIKKLKDLEGVNTELKDVSQKLRTTNKEYVDLNKLVSVLETHKELKESGYFHYKYKFEDIQHYKESLQIIKELQKRMISEKNVFLCEVAELEKSPIITGLRKLALRNFSTEFEAINDRLNHANYETCHDKVVDSFDTLNEELSVFNCKINSEYLKLKVKELALSLEYEMEVQRAKEQQAALKEQMRDEEDARIEAEEAREKAIVAEEKFEELLAKAHEEAQNASAEKQEEMKKKILDLENKLKTATEEKQRATALAQLTRKGHVYIISNIGSFGENVFKIGLTRREDPNERVKELGDASVPFKFDIHAVIKSEDAPKLENNLHQLLDDHRMNRVNARKEFFRVSLEQIMSKCNDLGYQVEPTHLAEAREYRETVELLNSKKSA